MNTKAMVIVVVAAVIGLTALARYRAGKNAITPGSVIPTSVEVSQAAVPSDVSSSRAPAPAVMTSMTLSVTSPANGSTVTSSTVAIKGKTAPKADVFVNELEGKADAGGNFSVTVTLEEGENYFVVLANDELGNAAEAELTVIYQP